MTEPTEEQRAAATAILNNTELADLDEAIAALIAERDTLHSICLRDQEAISVINGERLKALADLAAARAAHARLREAAYSEYVTFDRDAHALHCNLCQALTFESVDRFNANHASDCPLAPLPENK